MIRENSDRILKDGLPAGVSIGDFLRHRLTGELYKIDELGKFDYKRNRHITRWVLRGTKSQEILVFNSREDAARMFESIHSPNKLASDWLGDGI